MLFDTLMTFGVRRRVHTRDTNVLSLLQLSKRNIERSISLQNFESYSTFFDRSTSAIPEAYVTFIISQYDFIIPKYRKEIITCILDTFHNHSVKSRPHPDTDFDVMEMCLFHIKWDTRTLVFIIDEDDFGHEDTLLEDGQVKLQDIIEYIVLGPLYSSKSSPILEDLKQKLSNPS